jgi:acetylcholinesterase/cholinesterase
MPFMPTTDGYYEDIESAIDYLEGVNAFSNIKELMTGLVKDEGTIFPIMLNSKLFQNHTYPQIRNLTETRQLFIELAHNETDIPKSMISYAAESFIKGPKRDSPLKNIQRLSQALGDFIIVCPTLYLADEMIDRNKTVYMYSFNYRPKSSRFDEWMGVIHYEEVPFVFGYPLRKPKQYNKQDIEFSKKIMKIWTHFAKTGYEFYS